MSVFSTAGTTVALSAGVPATFNQAGYAALSYTAVGEITNIGEFGREFALILHNPVSTRGTKKLKGSYNEGQLSVQLGLDTDDSGQILMKTASGSDSLYAVKITTQNGDVYYMQALVMTFKVGLNGVDDITSATSTWEISTSSTGVGVVEVLA
jgi:hypothetical protein